MNIFKSYFSIRREESKLVELQTVSLKIYGAQMEIEKQLIERESPEVQHHLAREFEFQRAMNMLADSYSDRGIRFHYQPPSTGDTIVFARLLAKVTND